MLEKLLYIVNHCNTRVVGQVVKSKENYQLYDWILQQTNTLPPTSTVKERIYVILHADTPQCKNGNIRQFDSTNNKYRFCNSIDKCQCFKDHYTETRTPLSVETIKDLCEKRKQTWLSKYGVDNPSKNATIKCKRKETISRNSYSSMYQRLQHDKETIGYNTVVDRVKEFVSPNFTRDEYRGCFRKNFYKWSCNKCNAEIVDHVDYGRIPRCLSCYPNGSSKMEKVLREYIESLGFKVIANSKEILGNLEYDIWIPEKNVAIEYNGIYWHSSEHKDATYHVTKFIKSRDIGIKLIQIFEDEWLNHEDIVKQRLANILGVGNKIYARKCTLDDITPNEYIEFTKKYHLQGSASASFKLGLRYENRLVAVMSFSKSRYTSDGYELIRYCSDGTVVGGASKLFSFFTKKFSSPKIISYANRCWSDGGLYKTLGFTNVTIDDNNTGYWYIKNNKRYHRSCFTKSKLVKLGYDQSLTEEQIMQDAGYLKIHDCGNYKFEWVNPSTLV